MYCVVSKNWEETKFDLISYSISQVGNVFFKWNKKWPGTLCKLPMLVCNGKGKNQYHILSRCKILKFVTGDIIRHHFVIQRLQGADNAMIVSKVSKLKIHGLGSSYWNRQVIYFLPKEKNSLKRQETIYESVLHCGKVSNEEGLIDSLIWFA